MHIFAAETLSIFGSAITEWMANSGHSIHCCKMQDDLDLFKKNMAACAKDIEFDVVILPAREDVDIKRDRLDSTNTNQIHLETCQIICNHFTQVANKPEIILCPSSICIYSGSKLQPATELGPLGINPEALPYIQLEKTVSSLCEGRVRIVFLRIGDIINRFSVSSTLQAPSFTPGLVTFMGDKTRMVPWISKEDVVNALSFILDDPRINGPVNLVCGNHISRFEIVQLMAKVQNIKVASNLPNWLRNILPVSSGKNNFSNNYTVEPQKLFNKGFTFHHISLDEYLMENMN